MRTRYRHPSRALLKVAVMLTSDEREASKEFNLDCDRLDATRRLWAGRLRPELGTSLRDDPWSRTFTMQ
jgi:hypothetical protein